MEKELIQSFRQGNPVRLDNVFETQDEWLSVIQNTKLETYLQVIKTELGENYKKIPCPEYPDMPSDILGSTGLFMGTKIHKEIDFPTKKWEENMSQLTGTKTRMYSTFSVVLTPGGCIGPHLDGEYNSRIKNAWVAAEVSMLIYLNPVWKEQWGGILEFEIDNQWKPMGLPLRGTVLAFLGSKALNHRVTRTSLNAPKRTSLTTRWKTE